MSETATMPLTTETPEPTRGPDETRTHIRGSSLLLVGRLLALALGLGAQVLIVRYLSKADYGAFAYVLSLATLGSGVAVFGLDKSITRFAPIYQEQKDYRRLWGSVILAFGTIFAIGLGIAVVVYLGRGPLMDALRLHDPRALALLVPALALVPVQALDTLLVGLFAVFGSARAIFARKHLLGPGLQLLAVLALIGAHSTVLFLTVGYLAASALGVALYTVILLRVFRSKGLLTHLSRSTVVIPWREIFAFTIPLLVSDLAVVFRSSLVVILLERYHRTTDVATFRAVWPVSRLNLVVYQNFAFLFMPLASRMFARNDREGINSLYWRTALWIAVVSFPILVATCCVSQPLTELLFGRRYAQSAPILALLSLGCYFNAALGFNALTLRVVGRIRYLFAADLLGAAACLGASLLLIPRYGAMGAAVATCGTLILQNVLYQVGLLAANVRVFDRSYVAAYLSIAVGAVALAAVQWLMSPGVVVSLLLGAAVSLAVVSLNRGPLNVGHMFPELARIPVARRIFGTR